MNITTVVSGGAAAGLLRLVMVTMVLLSFAAGAFAQAGNAQLGGTVADPSNALIPGVTVTATNVDTNITQTTVSNESGSYNFPVLQPGTYKVSADLPGFRQAVFNDVRLPYAGQVRLNFTLQIGTTATTVEVSVAADSQLRESSASVGDVLTQSAILNLPMVGNNVLELLATLPGFRESPGAEVEGGGGTNNTVNGLSMDSVNTTRDGISVNDARNSTSTYGMNSLSTTTILPELVGEIRMILAPVDAELGRGNSQIQIATRSGTNRYTGSASWNAMNSALNANTWDNNHTPFTDPFSGQRTEYTPKTWTNRHQWTIAYGGPLSIPGLYDGRNKTFFYGVVSQNIRNTRDQVTGTPVLTATARQGIFRYWSGYNPVGWNPTQSGLINPVYPMSTTNASLIAVNDRGEPVRPLAAPNSPTGDPTAAGFIPYSGALTCFSVFGNMRLNESGGMVPFTDADCVGGQAIRPTGRAAWDNFRPIADTSGLIAKFLNATPLPNYFGGLDGLNSAQIRWNRGRSGTANTTTALGGTDVNANITQYNVKIDQNFTSNHKVAGSWTYQRDSSAIRPPSFPDGMFGTTFRRPHTLAVNGTSTLNSQMVNEARFGLTYTLNHEAPPWEHPDQTINSRARDLMLPAGNSVTNGDQYLALVNSASGNASASMGFMDTTWRSNYQRSLRYTVADTLSWSTGKHAFKFGVDYRLTDTAGNGGSQAYPTVTLGNASTTVTPSPFSTTATFNTPGDSVGYLPGLLNSAITGATAARTNVNSLLYYLSGSVASVTHNYWIGSADGAIQEKWDDISTQGERIRTQKSQEIALFVKDDFKVTRRLTLNLGLRWDFFGSPYFVGGHTSVFKDEYGIFGATRTAEGGTVEQFNSDPFSHFLRPGGLYLTGYGPNATNPLSCQQGVQQNPLLPLSTCNPEMLADTIFVGPGSPNPKLRGVPVSYGNFGPAIGFAYQLPWFGEGKTTIRGGYQQTFGSAGGNRGTIGGGTESALGNAPGAVTSGTLASHINDSVYQNILATRAITLGDIQSLVPMAPDQAKPGLPLTPFGASAGPAGGFGWNVYDPNLKATYTQNITLSVTRSVSRKVTVDMRYTGTLGRRLRGSLDINQNNVYHNPELFQALTDARAGTCTANAAGYQANYTSKGINPCNINGDPVILDQMLAGLNLNVNVTGTAPGSGTFGPVGTVNAAGIYQSGAQQMRRSATFQQNLSFGNFDGVADSLLGLAPSTAQGRQALPINPATGGQLTGVGHTGLRNGCDRLGRGFTIVQQTAVGGAQVANSGTAIPLRCFAEDFLSSNPQFGSVTYLTNTGRSSYNSLQTQVTVRPTLGISGTATWVWAKSFALPSSGYMNPADRNLDFSVQPLNAHALRVNGSIELPIGPNKLLMGNSSGLVARVLERWQASFIYNASSPVTATLNPGISHYYALSGYEVVSPNWVLPKSKATWIEGTNGGTIYPDQPFIGVTDPSCFNPSIVTMGDRMGTVLGRIPANPATGAEASGPCSITAIAKRNPDGTAGEILLQYPEPGKKGSLGKNNIQALGQWSFDMNLSKSFTFSETKSGQIRFDATNVLNHPGLDNPSLGGTTLGNIGGKNTNVRQIQGSLRLTF
jgi:hypothetical protein